jgi:hypothetical protein
MKRFVSLQFLNPKTVGRTPWTGNQPVARQLPTQDNINTEQTQTDIHALSGIQPTIPAFEQTKTVHVLDHMATVIGKWIITIV